MTFLIPSLRYLFLAVFALSSLSPALPGQAAGAAASYSTQNKFWQSANNAFSSWSRSGVSLDNAGALRFDAASAVSGTDTYPAKGYNGHNFYNGGRFLVGEAISPATTANFAFTQAIASWNATTPAGSWVETLLRVKIGARWTKWYNMGMWASDSSVIERHSVNQQGDSDGSVAVDTLILNKAKGFVGNAYQLKMRLFSVGGAAPSVTGVAVALATTPVKPTSLQPGNPSLWNTKLNVPVCSQMVYTDGGEAWCSPTSTSMVLGYWANDSGPCAPRVRAAVAGVFDWMYKGHGNWPFNTAYAASKGYQAFVARFTSLRQAEPWIASGVPVIISLAWNKNELSNATVSATTGHLTVLVGFDASGNPIVNDPAAPSNGSVQRVYKRAQYESLWLEHSGGTVYLIYPVGRLVPGL